MSGDGGGFVLYTLLVMFPTEGIHAFWKRVGVASDQLVVAVLQGPCSSQSLIARMGWSRSTTCCDTGSRCGRQGRRNSEVIATFVATTTDAVAATWLGDFDIACYCDQSRRCSG